MGTDLGTCAWSDSRISPAGATGGGIMDYWWVILLVVIIAAAIWYFSRGRTRV
jgi:hypothetical protein